MQRRFVDTLGWTILAVWVVSMVADGVVRNYDPPAIIHGLMTIVATAAFGSGLISRKDDDGS